MTSDSITSEIREIRRGLAAQFGYDVGLILADVRGREATDGRSYITLSPRRIAIESDEQGDTSKPRS